MAILGIDEVGRGPLAGPLVVGAVILPETNEEWYAKLNDSKKLTAKRREQLSELILANAATGLGWVTNLELDEVGISEALRLATRRAVKAVQRLHKPFSQIIIDGKVNFLQDTGLEKYVSVVVKADGLVKEVSAASIIAKVARDKYMVKLAETYPEYGFDSHVGYGTAKHIAAIREFGICPEHRKSFEPIKSMVGFERSGNVVKNTTFVGGLGEAKVCEFLEKKGHTIVARNFKTKYYEIDIVSLKGDELYFTEVKYRKDDACGGGLAAITPEKRRQMEFAAEMFREQNSELSSKQPLLAVAEVTGKDYVVKEWFTLVF